MPASRTFSAEDQVAFARLSGDANPMHMDALAARRTLAGEPVVHGVHMLLWALDRIAAECPGRLDAKSLRVDFRSFLHVGREAQLSAPSDSRTGTRATLSSAGATVLTLEIGAALRAQASAVADGPSALAAPEAPLDPDVAAIAGSSGRVAAPALDAAAEAFPQASAWLGAARVSALLACTRLVGMVCPGLHSIFNRIDVSFTPEARGEAGALAWTARDVDARFGRVNLAVRGPGLEGLLVASARPRPVRQESLAALAGRVSPDAFRGASPLVVGGSRGLGETTAKLLAAGGASVTLTYARGREDAERVAAEIRDGGGECRSVRYDAREDAREQLAAVETITSAYYFATGPIFTAKSSAYDRARLLDHLAIYVDGFDSLCRALSERGGPVGLYYPSSVAIDERPPGLTEYAMAKASGEILCADLNRAHQHMRILTTRLPRIATDQTATLLAAEAAVSSDVMLPIVVKVEAGGDVQPERAPA